MKKWKPIAQTMKGGIVQAMKPTMKIFSATAPVSCASSPAPALTPTMATNTTRPRSSSTLRAAFGVLPKKRSRDTIEDTITPESSSPPALPRPILAPKAGNSIMADQEAEDHAGRQCQQVGGRVGAGNATPHFRKLVDRGFQADDGDDVHPLQFGLEARRERHAAALEFA